MNQDPIGELGGVNLYRSLENSPPQVVDAFGLDVWIIRIWTGIWPHYVVVGDNFDGTYWYSELLPTDGGIRFPFILWGTVPLNTQGDARFIEISTWDPNDLDEGQRIVREIRCGENATQKAKELAKHTADPANPQPRWDVAGQNCWNYATRIADRAAAAKLGNWLRRGLRTSTGGK